MAPGASGDRVPVRMIVRPFPVQIPPSSPRRTPPRPVALRQPNYDAIFDTGTLYYDVFRSGDRVIAQGPPLLNLEPHVREWRYSSDGAALDRPHVHLLDRAHRAELQVPKRATTLTISDSNGTSQTVPIGPDFASEFAGTRALMTLQLDNDLHWIRDWVNWHVSSQGTDAVVVYDNGSKRYSLDELLDTISVPGIRVAAVVEWKYIFGPQGSTDLPWDSDFAQYGAIEHARRRFLPRAAGMLSVDIDELVYSVGDRSVYRYAAESAQGFIQIGGTWTYKDPASHNDRVSHADCQWVRVPDVTPPLKWCAVPGRLPARAQLAVHSSHGIALPRLSPARYWHMYPVSTSWKFDRSTTGSGPSVFRHEPLIADQIERYLVLGEPQKFGAAETSKHLATARARARIARAELWGRRLARRVLRRS